jgi:hypothetical protein
VATVNPSARVVRDAQRELIRQQLHGGLSTAQGPDDFGRMVIHGKLDVPQLVLVVEQSMRENFRNERTVQCDS